MKRKGRGGPREMRQDDFVTMWADASGIGRNEARRLILILGICVKNALVGGKSVRLPGIGVIDVVADPPRRYRDPNTRELEVAPARWNVKPVPSAALVDAVKALGEPTPDDIARHGRMARRRHSNGR